LFVCVRLLYDKVSYRHLRQISMPLFDRQWQRSPRALCLPFTVIVCIGAVARSAAVDTSTHHVVDVTWTVPDVLQRRLHGVNGSSSSIAFPEELMVKFTANGSVFELSLRRNRILLAAKARHVLHYADGRTAEGPMPQSCYYIGKVAGDSSSSVGLSACGGLSGFILAHGRALTLSPVGNFLTKLSGSGQHQVEHISDARFLDYQEDVAKYAHGPADGNASMGRRLTGSATKYVEAIVVNDNSRFQLFGGDSGMEALIAHTVSVMNDVTAIYNRDPTNGATFPYKVQVVLVGVHTLIQTDPWENTVRAAGSETDCSSLLDLFNDWGQTQQAAGAMSEHDNRILLSGRDFDGSTVGLAGVSAMCDVSRSGNVNMCGQGDAEISSCAAVVAHEIGHNLGMHHDSSGNACPQSGLIMEAVGGGDISMQFSHCSVSYIDTFFQQAYDVNGACLENLPTQVFGDPVCGNAFVEDGEDCDCGQADCSSIDPCCNGATCKFAQSTYECSASAGVCCESCMFVSASTHKVCRAVKNECDIAEYCAGGTASCPRDVHVYPGSTCSVNGYSGLCFAGKCSSLDSTCSVDIDRDFMQSNGGGWDLTERCAGYNDACGQLICHDKSSADDFECGQSFSTHGKQMPVPEGTPCWFPGEPLGTRNALCKLGACSLPHMLAEVPLCGNGGIDFGEECDCGATGDPCCQCSICKLDPTASCSGSDACCDSSTCSLKAEGTVCRAAIGDCDLAEVCSGTSAVCPSDVGQQWGTTCTGSDGLASKCYGKVCHASLDAQCTSKTDGVRPYGDVDPYGAVSNNNECQALMCCSQKEQLQGNWNFGNYGVVTDPLSLSGCLQSSSSHSFTVDGVTNTITLSSPADGTVLSDATKMCTGAVEVTPAASCSAGEVLDISVGLCLPCDSSCTTCSGPTNFDCDGNCKFGARDRRGACAISSDQVSFAAVASTLQASEPLVPITEPLAPITETAAPTAVPTALPTIAPTSLPPGNTYGPTAQPTTAVPTTEASTPGPPASTQTPAPTVAAATMKTTIMMESAADFSVSDFVTAMAAVTGADATSIAVIAVQFMIAASYVFPGGTSFSEDEAKQAIATRNNVELSMVLLEVLSGRRLHGEHERVTRRRLASVQVIANISTTDAAVAQRVQTSAQDTQGLAAELSTVTGATIEEPTVATTLSIKVETAMQSNTEGTSVAVPSGTAFATAFGEQIGKTVTVQIEASASASATTAAPTENPRLRIASAAYAARLCSVARLFALLSIVLACCL